MKYTKKYTHSILYQFRKNGRKIPTILIRFFSPPFFNYFKLKEAERKEMNKKNVCTDDDLTDDYVNC